MSSRAIPLLTFALAASLSCGSEAPREAPAAPPQAPSAPQEPAEPESPALALPPAPVGRTRVVILGSGTPEPDPERSGPCVAVVVDDVAYLVDAGPGLVRRAAAAALEGEPALRPRALRHAFLTHLHSDHTVGLPDLMLSTWVVGRDEPLRVHGPPGTEAMVEHLLSAYRRDREVRTEGLEDNGPVRVDARDVGPGEVYRDERVTVTAFAVAHGSWDHAHGYRFETPDRVVVISGDTAPTDAVVEACDGCDVLVHEVYSASRFAGLPPQAQRYHGAFHTSAVDLGALAARARPGRLVLYHHLLWGAEPEAVVAEVRRSFDGEVSFGRDLGVY